MTVFTCLLVEDSGKVAEVMSVGAIDAKAACDQALILASGRHGIASVEIWVDGQKRLQAGIASVLQGGVSNGRPAHHALWHSLADEWRGSRQ
jgi:hypothetical protein